MGATYESLTIHESHFEDIAYDLCFSMLNRGLIEAKNIDDIAKVIKSTLRFQAHLNATWEEGKEASTRSKMDTPAKKSRSTIP